MGIIAINNVTIKRISVNLMIKLKRIIAASF